MNLGAILVYADDFEAILAFDRDVEGLEVIEINAGPEYDEGVNFVYLDAGGPGVEIFDRSAHPSELPMSVGGSVRAAFQVDNLDATRDGLMARGIDAGDFVNRQWGRYVELTDPENNPPCDLPSSWVARSVCYPSVPWQVDASRPFVAQL